MSWQANAWAMRKGKDYELEPMTRFVFVTLSNYADPEGNDIYPSLTRLQADTGLSESTVRRHIKRLMDVRLLAYGDQDVVKQNKKIRADQRPKCYRFVMESDTAAAAVDFGAVGIDPDERGVTERPRTVNGRSHRHGTGCQTGCHSDTQYINPPNETKAGAAADDVAAAAAVPAVQASSEPTPEQIEAGRRLREDIAARNAARRAQVQSGPKTKEVR